PLPQFTVAAAASAVPGFVKRFRMLPVRGDLLQVGPGVRRTEQAQPTEGLGPEHQILLLVGDADERVFLSGGEEPDDDRPLDLRTAALIEDAELFSTAGAAQGDDCRVAKMRILFGFGNLD